MIFDVDGNTLTTAFNTLGAELEQAYDINGTEVWSTSNALRIMSFNVGSWGGYAQYVPDEETEYYLNLYRTIFGTNDADIVGIQEYCTRFGTSSALTLLGEFYPYIYYVNRKSNPTKAGRAIASKYALSNTAEINFTAQNGEVRSFLTSTFSFKGKTIYMVNTHLALVTTTISAQVQELLDYVSDKEYWILTGDFNARFNSTDSEGYQTLIEPFANAGYHFANGGDFGFIPTFYGSEGWQCIDNIFTSANIDITDVYRDETKLSATLTYGIDHLPLIADVTIN